MPTLSPPRDLLDIPDRSHQDLSIVSKKHRRVDFRRIIRAFSFAVRHFNKPHAHGAQHPKIQSFFGVFKLDVTGELETYQLRY
jgi:hypothetical protein